jgi:hypothetical protein
MGFNFGLQKDRFFSGRDEPIFYFNQNVEGLHEPALSRSAYRSAINPGTWKTMK